MLYFSWKYKNIFLYIFWDLIADLLKSYNLINILNFQITLNHKAVYFR
jgi:hypothetical protein